MLPYAVYLFITGGLPFCLQIAFTVSMVYQVQEVGLSPFQLVLVGSVLELTWINPYSKAGINSAKLWHQFAIASCQFRKGGEQRV